MPHNLLYFCINFSLPIHGKSKVNNETSGRLWQKHWAGTFIEASAIQRDEPKARLGFAMSLDIFVGFQTEDFPFILSCRCPFSFQSSFQKESAMQTGKQHSLMNVLLDQ